MLVLAIALSLVSHAETLASTEAAGTNYAAECNLKSVPDKCLPINPGKNGTSNACDPDKPRERECARKIFDLCIMDQRELDSCHNSSIKNVAGTGVCNSANLPKAYPMNQTKRIERLLALEKCLKEPEDYAAGALLLLHADSTQYRRKEIYLKAFKFARKAVELGDDCHRRYVAFAIKKLVGDGAKYSLGISSLADGCTCYSVRPAAGGVDLSEQLACYPVVRSARGGGYCRLKACADDPQAVPKNSIPGFW